MGKDLLYLVSSSGNHLGAKWLQSVLGEEYRVHTTEDIYGRQFNVGTLLLAQRLEKQVYVGLFPAFATDPYWTSSLQIADDNPVVMPFADGDLINMARGAGSPARSTCFCM